MTDFLFSGRETVSLIAETPTRQRRVFRHRAAESQTGYRGSASALKSKVAAFSLFRVGTGYRDVYLSV